MNAREFTKMLEELKTKGFTREKVAKAMGVSGQAISNYKCGRSRIPLERELAFKKIYKETMGGQPLKHKGTVPFNQEKLEDALRKYFNLNEPRNVLLAKLTNAITIKQKSLDEYFRLGYCSVKFRDELERLGIPYSSYKATEYEEETEKPTLVLNNNENSEMLIRISNELLLGRQEFFKPQMDMTEAIFDLLVKLADCWNVNSDDEQRKFNNARRKEL